MRRAPGVDDTDPNASTECGIAPMHADDPVPPTQTVDRIGERSRVQDALVDFGESYILTDGPVPGNRPDFQPGSPGAARQCAGKFPLVVCA